jgi:carbon storage regulator
MLILSRKTSESIVIDGRIHVRIVRVEGDVVKLGIEAPMDVPVHRKEVYDEIQRSNQQALTRQPAPLPKLKKLLKMEKAPKAGSPAPKPAARPRTPAPAKA